MPNVLSFQVEEAADQSAQWRRTTSAPKLVVRGGAMMVDAPADAAERVFLNGLPVLQSQPVQSGDLVRILHASGETTYVVGGPLPSAEPGNGRCCRFTGLPIAGQAVRCGCGGLFAAHVADQLGACPLCKSALVLTAERTFSPPPEELL